MFISVSDWPQTMLYIILTLIPVVHSGCYQKQLCCLGYNFTCIAVEDGVGHLPAKFRQQRLKKIGKGRLHVAVYNRKMKRTGKLVLRDLIPLNDAALETFSNHDYGLFGDYLNNEGKQSEAVKLPNSTAVSPFVHYQLIFGQPFYSGEQQPETTRYYQRHKLIRYSLLNRHIPLTVKDSRGIGWSNDVTKLAVMGNTAYDNSCYCDEKCVTFDDCCSDYSFVCPPSDCTVSEWSAWSQCIPDQGSCKTGIQTRKRTIDRKSEHGGMECPSLVEKMSCFKECPQLRRRHQSEITPVALILDYSYNKTRERFSRGNIYNEVIDSRNKLLYYCGIYELGWVNSNCIDKKIGIKLYTGNNICVECQPEAQLYGNTNKCTSDLNDGETGFWKLVGPKSCNGIWKKLLRADNCRCEINFPKHDAFLFV
ncbi:thrombospondin type 1 domain-containing protein [Loa loa]|uniref:Thrombospondin type 1 domain-containing protein n=1 Tax=Loa loa TaxID=7209 RepID=A0A1I7VTH0_LOALO|nr:thrombospondin type 1 domain-containing protein [Loa loa]EFO26469.2 thrombospondin type 1 domain-containing protein [Loa loa]